MTDPNRTLGEELPDYLNIPQGLALTDIVLKATSRRHGDFNPVSSGKPMSPAQMKLYLAAPTVARLGGWGKGAGGWDDFVLYSPSTNTTRPMAVGGFAVLPPDVTTGQYLAGTARTQSPVSMGIPAGLATLDFGTASQSTGVVPGYSIYGDTDFGLNMRRKDATGALTSGPAWSFGGSQVNRNSSGLNRGGFVVGTNAGRVRTYGETTSNAAGDPPPSGYMDLFFDSTTGHASRVDSSGAVVDLEAGGGLPTRYVSGLVIRYASTSSVTVSAGLCRNKADDDDMALASQVTVSTTTANAALGYERKTLTGTHTFTNGTGTVTGSGSAYLTEFGTRSLTGTFSNSGPTVTGVGTSFLSVVAVNDLIGNSTNGYYRVISIESDTSLTLVNTPSSLGGTDFTAGSTGNVIEQPVIETAGGRAHGLAVIYSNTSALVNWALTATETSVTAYASSKGAMNSSFDTARWRAVWLLSGGSGTTVVLSTQRTTPYLSTSGYTTSYRRIGWVRVNSSGNVVPAYGNDGGLHRMTQYEVSASTGGTRLLSDGNAPNTWTDLAAGAVVPPTSQLINLSLILYEPTTVVTLVARARGLGESAIERPGRQTRPSGTTDSSWFNVICPCDGAQYIQYASGNTGTSSGDGTFVDVVGYWDDLE